MLWQNLRHTSLSKHDKDAYDSLTFHREYGSSWADYANASESSYCPPASK